MIRAGLVLYLLCTSAVTHAGPAKSAHLLRWSTQSVATTGPKADDARLNLAHALTARGFPITAARLYVDILSARQSPSMTQQAETALEQLIWTHEFSPYWLTLGVLGKGEDAHTAATDSGVVAYLNAERVRREGHADWAQQQHWTQNAGWHNWSRIQEAHRALSLGDTQTATEALGAVNQPIDPALQPSLHTARVHLAWQQDDVAGVLFLLEQTSPTSTLPVEETLQRGWAYFKRGASGKAIGAARQVLRQDTTLFRQVEAAKLEGMVWLDTCQPNHVDTALNPVQKELEATIDAIAQGAHPHTLPNVREWMSHDPEFGALFALTAAAHHEQSGLAALGLQLPAVEHYIDLLNNMRPPIKQRWRGGSPNT